MASETITQADKDCALAILEADIAAGGQTPFVKTAAHYIAAHRRAAVAELVEALQEADAAIKEWFRYLHGGEMRGSYDGKPEREMLRKAGYRASAALSRHQAGLGKGDEQ